MEVVAIPVKQKAMLIGAIGSGKSTLTRALLGCEPEAVKTQSLIYYDWIVDTPGEYTENPMYYKNIMATSLEVTHVLYIQDATKNKSIFPPGFSTGINKLPVGVVTKSDHENAEVERAARMLKAVIPKGPVVFTSAKAGTGLEIIRKLVKCRSFNEMESLVSKMDNTDVIYYP